MSTPEQAAPAEPVETDYERGKREARAEIEREQAEAAAKQAEAERDAPPEPTHYLSLADGTTVDHFGAIPTHVAMEDGRVVPVAMAYAR